jgi:hypothetical protein
MSEYIHGYPLPMGNGYVYGLVPVTGNRYGFRYIIKVTDTSIQHCYSQIIYLLPSLRADLRAVCSPRQSRGLGWK